MKSTLRILIVATLALASQAFATAVDFGVRSWKAVKKFIFGPDLAKASADKPLPGAPAMLLKARQFWQRIVRRERATVMPSWRMVPST